MNSFKCRNKTNNMSDFISFISAATGFDEITTNYYNL